MNATLYKELSNKQTPIEVKAGQTIREALPDIDLENAIIVINGRKVDAEYILKENDVVTIRQTPAGTVALVVTMVVVAVVAVTAAIVGGIAAYKAKEAAKEAEKELEKVKKLTNKPEIDNRPFLRGANNTAATGNLQPYVMGRNFLTPYLLSSNFYKLTGTDGVNEYTYAALGCGFNKQIIKEIAIDDVKIKTFNITRPQDGAYNIDAGIFAEDGIVEIAQDGALLSNLTELNYKTESKACNDEIPKDALVLEGTKEYLLYTLNKYAKNVDVAITFPYGLYAMNNDGDKIETQLDITPQFSLDGGSSWQSFTFNNNGTQTTLFKRNVSTKELRFVAHKDFSYSDYATLHANNQSAIMIRIRSNGAAHDTKVHNDCYCLFYQSVCFDPNKSSAPAGTVSDGGTAGLVSCEILEARERAYCTILGLKIKATKINEDKLKKINIITQGMARTWQGSAWSNQKSATRNPAAWALEIETSDRHPASQYDDSELDLASFGEFYEHCEDNGYKFDYVCTQNQKKNTLLQHIMEATGACIFHDIYGRLAVAIDKAQENALAVYNPQNIISIQNKKSFGRRTDGLRIKYTSSENDIFQDETYLVMREENGQALPLTDDSIIKDLTVTGITTNAHVVKYARRCMAIEALRPKTTIIEVGNEGIFYTPLSKVLIQDDSLKIGIGNGFVISDVEYSGHYLSKIFINGLLTFEENKTYGIIVECYTATGSATMAIKVSGTGTTDTLNVLTSIRDDADDSKPEIGCVFSFGELDNGEFNKITTPYLINQIRRSEKGFNLELVNYDTAIYETGTIPEYKSNITQKQTDPAPEIPADFVTKRELDEVVDNMQSGNIPVGKPDTPTLIFGTANRDGITLSCAHNTDGLRNDLRNIVFTITRPNGTESIISSSGTIATYNFNRIIDGYPEAADLAQWSVTAKAVNIYGKESEKSEARLVSADTYGTWILNQPTVTNSTSKRSVILQLSTPSGSREQYSTIQYRVQVQKAGDDNWYKPDLISDPYADEGNYKDGEGYETVANTFIQSVPMESQEAGIKTTAYNYRIVGVSVETQAESEPTIITATATASTAMDIYDESIGVEKLAVKDLSAISGTFGDIKSDEIEKDATNYWILSKANSSLGYGRAGEFCVGTTASVEPFDLATNPTGYKEDDEFLHYLPSKTGSTLKGLFLKLANFIVDAIGSTITGAFRVEQKASRKRLFEVDDINQKVSGIQEQRGYEAYIAATDYDGLYDADIIKTIADGTNLVSITGQKKLVYNPETHTETVTDDLSVDIVKHNTEIWGLVGGAAVSGAKRKIALKTSPSAFEASRERRTCAVVGNKIYIPQYNGTALEIIDTITGAVETIANAFAKNRERITCAEVGGKIYIPQDGDTVLEIYDTVTGEVTTIANAFAENRYRYTSAVVEDKIYIPEHVGTALEIIDTATGEVTTIANAFAASRSRFTCAVVEDKIYIPQDDGTALEIIDTATGEVTTIANAFAAGRGRFTCAVIGDKIYIPQYNGTTLEIYDTATGQVTTIANAFEASRNRYTSAVIGDKIYIPQYNGTTLEIYDTATGQVTTIANAFAASRSRRTNAVVGNKIYLPQNDGTALDIIDTSPYLVSITSDGANVRGISKSEYFNWTTDITTPTGISASEILAFVYDSGYTWALDLAGGQILKDTEVIATTAQSGFTSAIYSGGKFYANKGNTIREITASTGNARVLALSEQAPHKLFVFGGKLYALPAKGATRITEIDLSTFAVVRSAQKDFLQLAGNPLAIANTAYIRQRGLMTEMTGLEWGLVTSRQLVEIGGGFVSREILSDGTRKLTTAGGEEIAFNADGDLVATQANAIKPYGNSITLSATPTSVTKIIKIATVDWTYAGTINIVSSGGFIADRVKIYIDGFNSDESGLRVVCGKNNTTYGIKKIVVTADGWSSNRHIYAEIVTHADYFSITTLGIVETNAGSFTPSMTEVSSVEGTVIDSLPLNYSRGDISSYQHVFTKDIIGNIYDTYSTEEHRIGTWIDGKPIYRRVVPLNISISAGDATFELAQGNIKNIYKMIGTRDYNTGNGSAFVPFETKVISTTTTTTTFGVYNQDGWMNMSHFIIEYTKTTD